MPLFHTQNALQVHSTKHSTKRSFQFYTESKRTEEILYKSFQETSITLIIPESDKDYIRKKNYRPMSLMNF